MKDIDVLYYSCPYDLSGYGAVSRNHLKNLIDYKKLGLNLRLRVKKFWGGVSPDLGEAGKALRDLEKTPIASENFIFLEHLTPENFFIDPRAGYHIAYTPFETDSAPISWLLPLRGMDEIWVPSRHNKSAYAKVGINPDKIHVIQHGVEIERFNPTVEPLKYNRGKFNFGSMFDWTERKNPIALIRAYYNAFFKGEDVTLTIRTFWRFPLEKSKEYIMSEVQKIKEGYGGRKHFPKILFWFDTLNEDIVPNLYRSFDCFVLPTRGEGFGLPFIEAMACGVPTIGPKWGGNTEFMNDANSMLVEGKVVPIENQMFLKMQPQYGGQSWFDINEVELSHAMRWVYDHAEKAQKIADNGVKDVQENWTWKKTAAKIYKRLEEINQMIKGSEVVKNDMNFMGVQGEDN